MTVVDDMGASALDEQARAQLDDVIDLRRAIHREPELGLHNPRTRDRILAALDGLDLDIRVGSGEVSWVTADLVGGDGPTVLLRADTDALPMTEDTDVDFRSAVEGTAHACGHDAHTAMLVGAARLLTSRRDEIAGRIRFAFQPGEEGYGGAREMISEGALEGVDAAYAIHISPNIPAGLIVSRSGSLMASADTFVITVGGAGGHASTPHFATDPIPIAAEIITAIQSMVTREIDAFDPTVITIARLEAGTTSNVIPESAVLEGTIRAVSEATRSRVHAALRRVAAGIASAHGATAETAIEPGYPVTVNHPSAVDLVESTTREVLGHDRWLTLPSPIMAAEDFSYFLQRVPGAMAFLGVCPDDIEDSLTAPSCHSNRM
ncbi:MAG: M20 family metallopeptidase, partial [Acidimicrobiales bacterium]